MALIQINAIVFGLATILMNGSISENNSDFHLARTALNSGSIRKYGGKNSFGRMITRVLANTGTGPS